MVSQTYSRTPKETLEIAGLVEYCFGALNTYGKTADNLPMIIGAFDHVLRKYNIDDIKDAFNFYLDNESVMPTPSDIVKIINPPVVWCRDKFKNIDERMKSDTQYVSIADEKYHKAYLNRF